jgi:predicted ATPase/class 3 adenylate cyclase/tRNA A-37 threonylcarbamoyl transferase component Bud32
MFSIGQYQIIENIYEGDNTLIFRALDGQSGQRVLIKALQAEYPPLDDIVRTKREYEIAQRVEWDGVVRPLALEPYKNGYALVLEDFGGESLQQYLSYARMDTFAFLEVAIALAETLGRMHQKNIIHKDIKPHNIIVNVPQGVVKITDFGIASLLSSERQEMLNPHQLEGTLPYMSPEQTGRMNRMIDYRTDFYSLGVTFYEMLTGQLPFPTNDPVEVIHSHIAKQPVAPSEIAPAVPRAISQIVLRCLAKNAEDRYQSAYGLKSDLETCLRRLNAGKSLDAFVVGQADKSEIFKIPEKLYGRDQDVETLTRVFDRVSQGAGEMLLVSGFSGIGKSFLVHEVKPPVVREKGFFVSGKFDQFKRHLPYSGLIQALQQLIRQLLTESEQSMLAWKDKLLQALGPNGQILIDVIPELELIIGKQPAVSKLPPIETQNRFQLTMQFFLGVFTKKEHPFVLFLDDLQWADLPSLNLIEYLMSDPGTSYLLFIGAYRDNEVSASDRLMLMIDELRKKQVRIHEIFLAQLGFEQVQQLISDTLQCEQEQTRELTALVMDKTKGNPFFVKQFLTTLHSLGLVTYELTTGGWRWELEPIRELGITDNVVDFMLSKIQELPARTQRTLQVAACIDNTFDVQTLAMALGQDLRTVADDLWNALEEGLLVPLGTSYKLLYNVTSTEDVNASFKFLHDRVQQVAYSLLPDPVRQEVHLKIGRWLRTLSTVEDGEVSIFHMVNHLNEGRALIDNPAEREELAQLNLEAGQRAKASTAYEPAFKYLTQGVELLKADCWQSQYDLAFDLYVEQTEVEYLCGQLDRAERNFDLLLSEVKTPLEKANVYNIRTILYSTRGRYQEAVDIGIEAVNMLGMKLPARASKLAVLRELLQAKMRARGRVIEDLVHLPLVTDPVPSQAMKILLNIAAAAYFVDQNLFLLINLRIFNLTLKYGSSIASGLAYGGYGILLGSGFGDYRLGYRYGELALKVDDIFDELFSAEIGNLKNKGYFGHAIMIMPWCEHMCNSLPHLRIAYQSALDSGDLIYAVYAAAHNLHIMLLSGLPLTDILHEADKLYDFVVQAQVEDFSDNFLVMRGMVNCLRGQTVETLSFTDSGFDEDAYVQQIQADALHEKQSWYYFSKMKVLYLMDEYAEAMKMAQESDRIIGAMMAQLQIPEHLFYYSLVMTACFPFVEAAEQKQFLKKLHKHQKKMKKWADHAPENFLHRYLLVEAERARLAGETQRAMDLYDQAIASALEHGFTQNAAIANECAGRFYLAKGKTKIAKAYLAEARYGYLMWGALIKVKQMDQHYPHWLTSAHQVVDARMEVAATTNAIVLATTESSYHTIDLLSVMKASRAISGEIVLEKLLEHMIDIVVENAGAEKGFLLLMQDEELLIEAEKHLGQQTVSVLQSTPVEQCNDLSPTIIQYVRRMREEVVLHDATKAGMFSKDPYIQGQQPKSILCLPVVNQGRLVGVLYLENNLTTHAFTKDRFEVMKLLASQIAVSIENAKLYRHQVQLNEAYERFVPQQFLRFLEKKSIIDVQLGDHVQTEMTVLFSDIRSFTTLSERLTPEENFNFLNHYLNQMEPLILEHHGFIDKYIGDSIMSLFDKGADDAVNAGIAMLNQLAAYNEDRAEQGEAPIEIGIGINSGRLMLGTLGGHHRMDSTVISDAVNLASRIEGLTKTYGTCLLISEHTYLQLKDPQRYLVRIIDRVRVKGKSELVSIYEVFDADDTALREGKLQAKEVFEQAYTLYHGGQFAEALELFTHCQYIVPMDKTTRLYLDRCQRRLEFGEEIDWNSTSELLSSTAKGDKL